MNKYNTNIISLLLPIMRDGMINDGFQNFIIKQSYQPLKTGVPEADTVYIHKMFTSFYGTDRTRYNYNEDNDNFDEDNTNWYVDSYQISALTQIDPNENNIKTAHDIVTVMAKWLNTRHVIDRLATNDIFIDRIQTIRQGYFVDDKERHEQSPSFDVSFTYQNITKIQNIPKIDRIEIRTTSI